MQLMDANGGQLLSILLVRSKKGLDGSAAVASRWGFAGADGFLLHQASHLSYANDGLITR